VKVSRFLHWPRTISKQLICILIVCMVTTIFLIAALLYEFRPYVPPLPDGPWPNALAIETGIEAIRSAPEGLRATIAERISTKDLMFQTGHPPECLSLAQDHLSELLRRILNVRFGQEGENIIVKTCALDMNGDTVASVHLPSQGIFVLARESVHFHWPQILRMTLPLIVSFGSLLVMIIVISIWCIRRINHPLTVLASRAEAFGYDISPAPLPEKGPTEIRNVACAFNRMQARIAYVVEERKRILMAVGHDLRTPLTRLSLRVEMGGSELEQATMRRDLVMMNRMLNGALAFLKEEEEAASTEVVDIGSLVESLCSDFTDMGKNVVFSGNAKLVCVCDAVALSRAISNLIDNACKFGENVSVNLWCQDDHAMIEVVDDGPGIPAEFRETAILPFARLDPARTSQGGLGLGLAIVKAIVDRHYGKLMFTDASPHGLIARIAIPLNRDRRLAAMIFS